MFNFLYLDAAPLYSIYFQEEATLSMIGIRDLHDNIFFYILFILIFVTYFIIINTYQVNLSIRFKDLIHNSILEIFWTLLPAFLLFIIAIPTFKLLYNLDDVLKPLITLKIEGNQWFWNYSINDTIGLNIDFSSYPLSSYEDGKIKYLDVDQRVLLPILTPIRLLFTASDVIHSWTIPSFGIKVDCIPGRINHALLYILREGLFFGQCSELCGLAHSNMPICVEGVNSGKYLNWLLNFNDFSILPFFTLTNYFKSII